MVDVYNYLHPSDFLRDAYKERRQTSRTFSHRQICGRLGLKSHSFFSHMLEKRTRIPHGMVGKLAAVFELSKDQREYFEALVIYERATNDAVRRWIRQRLYQLKSSRPIQVTPNQQDAYARWYHSALKVLVCCDGRRSPAQMASMLEPEITQEQAESAIEALLKCKAIDRSQDGKLVLKDRRTTTGLDFPNKRLLDRYHLEMMGLAAEAVDSKPRERREISGVTLAVSEKGAKEAKAILGRARRELLAAASLDSGVDRVYQVNMQLFPLTKLTARRR